MCLSARAGLARYIACRVGGSLSTANVIGLFFDENDDLGKGLTADFVPDIPDNFAVVF